ncbi:MAG TPA: hypothetical protein VFU32_07965 [Ktedonobacterales bacterium]|nr:hypothetical protein [Ktedonobacterales bacterium]
MPDDSAEAAPSAGQPNSKLLKLLLVIALNLAVLMIFLVLAALGFLLYGLITAKLGQSIIGVVVSVICFSLLFGLFRWIIKAAHLQAQGQKERSLDEVTTGKTTYARVKNELSTRYGRAKSDED